MYSEFQESILYRPSIIDPDDRLVFVLFGENVFKVDSVLSRASSFEGVKTADAFIVTKLQYYDDWIVREIDKRLPRRSIKVAPTSVWICLKLVLLTLHVERLPQMQKQEKGGTASS